MPTIQDIPPRRHAQAPARRRSSRGAWPLALLIAIVLLALWRISTAGGDEPAATPGGVAQRTHADARLHVPRTWVVLDRSAEHVTWGEPDRAHTVTLASTEASTLPLPGIVSATVDRTAEELPGVRATRAAREIDLQDAPRADSAMLASFRVTGDGSDLEVVQVWRRDTRAGRDVLATWTSVDGRWPVDPRAAVPSAYTSR